MKNRFIFQVKISKVLSLIPETTFSYNQLLLGIKGNVTKFNKFGRSDELVGIYYSTTLMIHF